MAKAQSRENPGGKRKKLRLTVWIAMPSWRVEMTVARFRIPSKTGNG